MPLSGHSAVDLRRFLITLLLILGMFFALDARDGNRADDIRKEQSAGRERGYINRAVACFTIADDVTPTYRLPDDCGDPPVARLLLGYGVPPEDIPSQGVRP